MLLPGSSDPSPPTVQYDLDRRAMDQPEQQIKGGEAWEADTVEQLEG